MPLFGKKDSYLGIDFDTSSVKIVELKNMSGRPRLVTYGFFNRPAGKTGALDSNDVEKTAKLIRQVCAKAKITSRKVITAMPAFSVFSSILTLPVMSKKDLASAIKWEAKKVIPLPIEDMIIDWKLLEGVELETLDPGGSSEEEPESKALGQLGGLKVSRRKNLKIKQQKEGKYTKVLLTAAPKDLVRRYVEVFKTAGLTLLSLDTESFALVRSLVGNDKSSLMVVDMGAVVTNISIINNGIPTFNRSMDVGGATITQAIANSLNISLDRAEQFKYDIGMNPERIGQGSVPKTIEDTLTPIVDELKYSLNLYREQGKRPIEKLILTGGSSLLLNLPNYFANLLGLKVYLGDPWARVVYPEELKPVLDEVGARFSVAIGLAMRNIE